MKGFKDWLDLIIKIVAVVGLLSGVLGIRGCMNQKESKENFIDVLTGQVEQIKTESGKNAAKANNWKLKYKSLNKYTIDLKNQSNSEISRFKAELYNAKQTIADLEIRQRNVQNYIKNELISKDSLKTELIFFDCDSIEIKPIKKKHIKLDFIQSGNILDIKYEYSASVQTVISRYPELKDNGRKHFPNWGFLPWVGWDYKTTSVIDDPNATISNLVSIEFDK